MKVFIHIGGAKTGTSTIQECLLQNKQILAQHGYSYLHMEGRNEYRDLPAYCMNPDRYDHYFKINFVNNAEQRQAFDERFLETFRKKMNELPSDAHTLVISSEHLSSRLRTVDEIERLKALLADVATEFRICYYIRSQANKVSSSYSTKIKSGGTVSFEDYFEDFSSRADSNYDRILTMWEEVFGQQNINVRLFDRAEFYDGDLLQDFFQILHPKIAEYLNTETSTQNTSLSTTGIVLARWINRVIPKFHPKRGVSKVNRALIELVSLCVRGKPMKLNPGQKAFVMKNYKLSNEQVRQRYFPDRKNLF